MSPDFKAALLRHNQNVPRYTSYPPANFLAENGVGAMHTLFLGQITAGDAVSLYIHIPFCPSMCWFCGCHTQATTRYEPVADYLVWLRVEMGLVRAALGALPRITHVHFGGGSPTMLTPVDFGAVMDDLRRTFDIGDRARVAIEIDPRQITPDKIKAYADHGVTRVSLGVQDTDPVVMQAINRHQPFDLTARTVEMCRTHGLDHINIDLVYGLPHQTVAGMIETARQVCDLSPNRLALFGYAHVPWMKKHMRLIPVEDMPGPTARYDLFEVGAAEIERHGYVPIGIDHFARGDDSQVTAKNRGTLGRNFQGYVDQDDHGPLIGMGVSSISEFLGGMVQNTPHGPHYRDALRDGQLPSARYHGYTLDDAWRGAAIERLMCDGQVDVMAVLREHSQVGIDLDAERALLYPYLQDGLAHFQAPFHITVPHRLAVRMVAACFDTYRRPHAIVAPRRHSAAV